MNMDLQTIYTADNYDARLVAGNMNSHSDLIEKSVKHACPLLIIRPPIVFYGKTIGQPRDVAFFSDESEGYYYSRKMMHSIPLSEDMKQLISIVNQLFGGEYNGILINRYNDGNDYISAHSDDEKDIKNNCGVVSLSYGATRKFRIRSKNDKKIVADYDVKSGDIVEMQGADFQGKITHEIPVQKKIKNVRYSLTFRKHSK